MMIFTQMAGKYKFVELEADSSIFVMSELQPLYEDSDDENDFGTNVMQLIEVASMNRINALDKT